MNAKVAIVIVAGMLASGCASEQPAKGKTLAALQSQCEAYGFKPGSDVYAACVFQADQNRINDNRNARLRLAAALQQTGAQMQQNANQQAMINAMNRPRTCYTSGYGNTLRTQCY